MKKIAFLIVALMIWWFWPKIFPANESVYSPQESATQLAGAEQAYYQKVFDYAMDTLKPGQSYAWESYSAKGSFTIDKSYVSKSKSRCKQYHEEFTSAAGTSMRDGIACKREGREGWCLIGPKDAQTCAMEKPSGIVDQTSRGVDDAVESSKEVLGKVKGWWR